ncbi:MAG: hypothetical protein JKY94_13045 [Rhodobacteraceae bacterium]|nr:hypothetical protein [Paracoccaceae bacterium]
MKRISADNKGDITDRLPIIPAKKKFFPMDCIKFVSNGDEDDLRNRLIFPAIESELNVSDQFKSHKITVKHQVS